MAEEELTGFDSESDRRDAVRKQVVDRSAAYVLNVVREHSVTGGQAEGAYLLVSVAERLIQSIALDAKTLMYREEIHTATEEIEDDGATTR